jgi:putative multiple sugar transport system ATP-binding protein
MDIKDNICLPNYRMIQKGFSIDEYQKSKYSEKYCRELQIKTPFLEQKVKNLSGGNQQKVVLAKWMMSHPKILIFDEPTRGIDVGAKYEIYCIMNELVKQGLSIIMISSELPEVLGMSDRILVMSEGRLTAEYKKGEANPDLIMKAATAARQNTEIRPGN